jgi:hypothetical protein
VEFRGTIQFDDVWQPSGLPRSSLIQALLAMVAFGAIFGMPLTHLVLDDLAFDDVDFLWRAPIYGAGVLMAGAATMGFLWMARAMDRQRARRQFKDEDVEGWFASEAIEIAASGMRQTMGWQAFVGYDTASHREPIVWLLRPGAASALPMPRRFFGSEDDWRRFEGLVASRLPRGGRSAKEEPKNGNQAPALPVVAGGIQFSGTLNGQHLARARRLLGVRQSKWWLTAVWIVMLGVFMVFVLHRLLGAQPLVALVAVCAVSLVVITFLLQRRSERIELHGVVEESGIRVVEPLAETWFGWESYLEYYHDERPTPMVVLLLPENRIHVFPREVFAGDDGWQAFFARVEQHVQPAG